MLKRLLKEGQTDVKLLDSQKSFDNALHKQLLARLDHYWIQGDLNALISSLNENFFSNGTQRVVIGGEDSSEVNVTSGVLFPPTVYQWFANESRSQVDLFADNCILCRDTVDRKST